MTTAKDIQLRPITSTQAREVIKEHHYSGKPVNNSNLHIGVYLNGNLEGAMQLGPPPRQTETNQPRRRHRLGKHDGTQPHGVQRPPTQKQRITRPRSVSESPTQTRPTSQMDRVIRRRNPMRRRNHLQGSRLRPHRNQTQPQPRTLPQRHSHPQNDPRIQPHPTKTRSQREKLLRHHQRQIQLDPIRPTLQRRNHPRLPTPVHQIHRPHLAQPPHHTRLAVRRDRTTRSRHVPRRKTLKSLEPWGQ